ncbi:MAG: transposase [Bdellovibrionales bacterium]|nr:transposase [Bdellovibrionales bacterium]
MQSSAFGGDLLKNSNAKTKRPFSPRAAIHVVLRTRNAFSLLKRGRRARIAQIVESHAKRHLVHIHRFANAGSHLHVLIECRDRTRFRNFLRAVSGAIALLVKLEEKQTQTESFWLQRPWTRLVAASGRAFVNVWRYVDLNEVECSAWGITRAEARAIQYGDLGPPKPWLTF